MANRSEVSICNQALGWCGANPITTFQDGANPDEPNAKEANLCLQNYDALRDAVLEEDIWTFATKRDQLPALSEVPLGWGVAYQLPSDCLRVDRAFKSADMRDQDEVPYLVEDRKILLNRDVCFVRYVFRQEDVTRFSPNFTQALAYRIATELSIPLTKSKTLQQQFFGLYRDKLEKAMITDGTQNPNRETHVGWMTKSR